MQETGQSLTLLSTLALLAPFVTGGLAGAVLTYVFKVRSERQQKKIVSVYITDLSLSLPSIRAADMFPSGSLKISFEHQVFDNLRLYTVFVKNVGFRAVEGMKLALSFPKDTTQIKTISSSEPLSILCTLDTTIENSRTEMIYAIGRLEIRDRVRLSFLIDSQRSNAIECLPRGVDDVEFLITKDEYQEPYVPEAGIRPAYKVICGITLSFSIISSLLFLVIVAATPSSRSPEVIQLLEASETAFKIGFGAVFGLSAGALLR